MIAVFGIEGALAWGINFAQDLALQFRDLTTQERTARCLPAAPDSDAALHSLAAAAAVAAAGAEPVGEAWRPAAPGWEEVGRIRVDIAGGESEGGRPDSELPLPPPGAVITQQMFERLGPSLKGQVLEFYNEKSMEVRTTSSPAHSPTNQPPPVHFAEASGRPGRSPTCPGPGPRPSRPGS